MNDTEKKTETLEEKRARLLTKQQERDKKREQARLEREVERLELVEKFEEELKGAEGQEFAIYDSGELGEGFFVVKRGASVAFTRYADSKMNPSDRYDFVAPHVVHPTIEKFKEALERRPAIGIELANRLGVLYGMKLRIDEGK